MRIKISTVNYTVPDGEPVIHVFGRDKNNDVQHVKVRGFRPYFYVPDDETEDLKQEVVDTEPFNPETGDKYTTIRGDEVTKLYTTIPREVGEIRDDYTHYEGDVPFPTRFMVDMDVGGTIEVPERRTDRDGNIICQPKHVSTDCEELHEADLRVHVLDIEVDDRFGFPENGEQEIICFTTYDSYRDEYIAWLYEGDEVEGAPNLHDYDFMSETPTLEVRSYQTEERMLYEYLDYIEETDPSLLTGWNFDDFDMPYLLDRLDVLKEESDLDLSPTRLSRLGEIWDRGNSWSGPNVKGRVIFDLLDAYKATQFTELESYRLDAVGEMELGVGKETYTGDLGDLWIEDTKKFLEYNVKDVELVVEINRKQEVIDFWDALSGYVGCQIEETNPISDACDVYVLQMLSDKFVLPSKDVKDYEDYEGGAVFEPIEGVEDYVTVLDLKSLYPMSMVTINASPETKVENPEEFDGEMYEAPNGAHFRKDQDGVIREMVDDLLAERESLKDKRNSFDPDSSEYETYDRQQASVKVLMNSLYGVLGWERFRLYDKVMGAAVTATGRSVIKFTEKCVEELGYSVTYGDTDSVMYSLSDINPDEVDDWEISDKLREEHGDMDEDTLEMIAACLHLSHESEEYINERYDDFAQEELNADNHRFQIEFEKLYKRFFQAGKKKRYAGHIVWKEGKYVDNTDVTGFETERSDIAQITKTIQNEVFDLILSGADKDEVREYVTDRVEEIKNGEVDLETIGIPGGLGQSLNEYDNPGSHPRACIYSNLLLDTNFGSGDKPKRVCLDRVDESFYEEMEQERGLRPMDNDTYLEFKNQFKESGYWRDKDPVIAFEYPEQLPEEFNIDYDLMVEKTLEGPISRVISAMGVEWSEVTSGTKQTGLGAF